MMLASQMLRDTYEKQCTRAALLSSDSDFVLPVQIAQKKLPDGVVILNPNVGHANELKRHAGAYIHIDEATLRSSLLPRAVWGGDDKVVERPEGW